MNMEQKDAFPTIDIQLFGEIPCNEPDELQAETYSQEQYNNILTVKLPEGLNLRCVGILNGEPVYIIQPDSLTPPVSAPLPPQPTASNSVKQKCESGEYVKKPPNAFMLFAQEQRAIVKVEIGARGAAAVNTILGQRWRSLTDEEQAIYYKQAEKLKELHVQQHPEWSHKDNYGKKKKSIIRKSNATKAEESDALGCTSSSVLNDVRFGAI